MATKFSKEYNKDARRRVYNFNRTRNRAERAGVPKNRLPRTVKLSDLKKSTKSKQELNKILNQLDKFTRKSTSDFIQIDNEFKTTKWNYDFLERNRKLAKDYFKTEYKRVEKRTGRFPGERGYLDTINAKMKVLDKDINKLSGKEFQAALNATYEFMEAPSVRKNKYRGFLSAVEEVMDVIGVKKEQKDAFFKKFEQLTPTQFLYAYDNNDIIARVYELYFKRNEEGEVLLNTDLNSAKEIIDSLFEQADFIIEDAKVNSV